MIQAQKIASIVWNDDIDFKYYQLKFIKMVELIAFKLGFYLDKKRARAVFLMSFISI